MELSKVLVFLLFLTLSFSRKITNDTYREVKKAIGYDIYCVGNCNRDVTPSTKGGLMMMGGATDVDEAFLWMISNGGNGDIVVIRTSGTDAYNDYIYELDECNSVTTIVIRTRAGAAAVEVESAIRKAEGLFMAGGDQSSYYNLWKDTPVHDAISYLINTKKVTIGGTSAGLHVLGEFIYTGETGGVYSDEALANPYNEYMTFGFDFISHPLARDILTDSHFKERDRMGRHIAFLARMIQDGETSAGTKGISVSEETALLVDAIGYSYRVGVGPVYLLKATERPTVCQRGRPLSIQSVLVYKLDAGINDGSFNIVTWTGKGGREYYIDVENGKLFSTQPGGAIY